MSEDFKIWWHREGSGMPPLKGEDTCEHVERVSAIAWSNGAYKATEALKADNARLKAEVERLTKERDKALTDFWYIHEGYFRLQAEVNRLTAFTTRTIIPNKELQAQVERLTKAGDAMAVHLAGCYRSEGYDPKKCRAIDIWNAAKEGKPRA